LFAALNAGFALLLATGLVLGNAAGVHVGYVALLFLLCSSPLLAMQKLNDRYALLGMFSAYYFVLYGALDVSHLLFGVKDGIAVKDFGALLSETEQLILAAGVVLHLAYHIACRLFGASRSAAQLRDWPERTLVVGGVALWAVCTWAVWVLNVQILVKVTNDVVSSAYAQMSPVKIILFMLAGYFQPLGIVIVAYAQTRFRRGYMIPLLVAMVIVEMVYGFVSDQKGQVLVGLVLIALTRFLIRGRIPVLQIAVGLLVAMLVFPVLQANRRVRGDYDLTHADALQQIGRTLGRALDTTKTVSEGPDRADTLLERSSIKANVELIVSRTGRGVAFQNGYTIAPLLMVFIPRIFAPEKTEVKTGQVFNSAFSIADSDNVYISTSHLGELYWNYGWTGALIGMALIGSALGVLAALTDLSQAVNLTRVLILLVTVKLLALGFESTIATQYSLWIRSLAGIGLLHWLFARRSSQETPDQSATAGLVSPDAAPRPASSTAHLRPLYPNLSS
jgi:hypothetical protein